MSARPEFSPDEEAWIEEQMSHFTPADLEPAVRLMRQYALQARPQGQRGAA